MSSIPLCGLTTSSIAHYSRVFGFIAPFERNTIPCADGCAVAMEVCTTNLARTDE